MPSFDPAAGLRCNLQNQNALRCTLLSKFHAVNAKRGHPSDVFPYARMKKFLIMKAELQMQRLLGSKCLLIKKDLAHVNSVFCVLSGTEQAAARNPSLLACGPDYWRDSESLI